MNPLVRFWEERYGLGPSLEVDSRFRRLLNTYVVAALMNRFPRAATRVFARSHGELARLLFHEREGGSFRVLRTMYRFEDAHQRGDLLNRLLMQSPAVKAARNRRKIAQAMLRDCCHNLPSGSPRLVLAVGGGDGSLESEVIAGVAEQKLYYCGVDRDERAVSENRKVLEEHGIERRGFTFVGRVSDRRDLEEVLENASRRFGIHFDAISVAVCQGIVEYLDIGSDSNHALAGLLRALHDCTREDGSLIISQTDFHDRVAFLEQGLSWYMRLRGGDEVAAEIEKAGWQMATCEKEPMKLITMCRAVKSDTRHSLLRGKSHWKPPHMTGQAASAAGRRGRTGSR
jgi:SAM-dependent methyltransferase